LEAVPAWLELDRSAIPITTPTTWSTVAEHLARRDPVDVLARAGLLGLPVARVAEAAETTAIGRTVLEQSTIDPAVPVGRSGPPLVVDLSSLWAGPLCGDLLASTGATVVKVESTSRPDGARRGPAAFFDLLNAQKQSVALDFRRREDVGILRELIGRADVVIEASRPRALAHLGIDATASIGPRVWISITGHGRDAGRVAFGDDAAAAGGLVVWSDGRPYFCADAIADPLTGLAAAAACLEVLSAAGRWMLDVSMAGVAAQCSGRTLTGAPVGPVAPPRARPTKRVAPTMGADTEAVLTGLGIGR
jgi:crotonobetainyl-CoA:carnitine CoA-transferase CaiB-like acyl-CoA transferase